MSALDRLDYGTRPLQILILVDQFPELSETFIASEAHALAAAGHQVHIEAGARAPHSNLEAAEGLSVAYIADGGRWQRLRDLAWLVARHPLRSAADLRRRRRWRREEDVRPLRRLAPAARRARQFRADHLHAHFAAGAALDALRIGALLGIPYDVMTHGYDLFQLPRNLREKHERAAFAVTACEYSASYLRERLPPDAAGRVHKLVVGVDGETFRRTRPHSARGPVLAVGRLVEKKGFRYLIEAAQFVPDARVQIVGDGPLRGELVELAQRLSVDDRVEMLGSRTPGEVRDLLESAAVVAVPSVLAANGDRDTMPVIAKEALAMEVPVVASDEVGLPEVVAPEWGRLVPPAEPVALAGALREILSLPREERAELGRAGREHVLLECDLHRETAKLVNLIGAARLSVEEECVLQQD